MSKLTCKFLPRLIAITYNPQPKTAMISITDPDQNPVDFVFAEKFEKIFRISFYDVDCIDGPTAPKGIPKQEHALQLIKFADDCYNGDVEHIIVHCEAGCSRSPAVALFLNECYGYKLEEKDWYAAYGANIRLVHYLSIETQEFIQIPHYNAEKLGLDTGKLFLFGED